MVEDGDAHDFAGIKHLACHTEVFRRRGGIARRVVVDKDDVDRGDAYTCPKYLPRMHQGRIGKSLRNQNGTLPDEPAFAVEGENEEILLMDVEQSGTDEFGDMQRLGEGLVGRRMLRRDAAGDFKDGGKFNGFDGVEPGQFERHQFFGRRLGEFFKCAVVGEQQRCQFKDVAPFRACAEKNRQKVFVAHGFAPAFEQKFARAAFLIGVDGFKRKFRGDFADEG